MVAWKQPLDISDIWAMSLFLFGKQVRDSKQSIKENIMTKTIENTSTIYTGKFNNPSECVYYMQITGMSLGDFLKDCANRAKEHYFDTVTGKDLKGLEEIQSSIRENCELLDELTADSIIESVIGEQVPYSDDDMTEYYEDSDEVLGWDIEPLGELTDIEQDDWKFYHIN